MYNVSSTNLQHLIANGRVHPVFHGDLFLSAGDPRAFLHDAAVARSHPLQPLQDHTAGDIQHHEQAIGEGREG